MSSDTTTHQACQPRSLEDHCTPSNALQDTPCPCLCREHQDPASATLLVPQKATVCPPTLSNPKTPSCHATTSSGMDCPRTSPRQIPWTNLCQVSPDGSNSRTSNSLIFSSQAADRNDAKLRRMITMKDYDCMITIQLNSFSPRNYHRSVKLRKFKLRKIFKLSLYHLPPGESNFNPKFLCSPTHLLLEHIRDLYLNRFC